MKGGGTQAAVERALAEKPIEIAEDEQIELLPDLIGTKKGDGRAQSGKVGRPAGATNKRVTEYANYLLSRYSSPLEVLAQIATARVDDLKKEIGCTKLAALQEKRLAAMALLPYVHQKMPVAVDVTNRKIVQLVIEDDSAGGVHLEDTGDDFTLTAQIIDAVAKSDE